MRGVTAQCCAIDAVCLVSPSLAADGALGRVGGNPRNASQILRIARNSSRPMAAALLPSLTARAIWFTLRPMAPNSLAANLRAVSSSFGNGGNDRRCDRTSTDTYVADAIPRAAAHSCKSSGPLPAVLRTDWRLELGAWNIVRAPMTWLASIAPASDRFSSDIDSTAR